VRLERAGLKRLRSLTKAGRCVPPDQNAGAAAQGDVAAGTGPVVVASSQSVKDAGSKHGRDASGSGRGRGRGGDGNAGGNGGGRGSTGDGAGTGGDRGGVAGRSITNLPLATGGGMSWLLLLAALVLAAVAVRTLFPIVQRRRRDRQLAQSYASAPQRATFAAPAAVSSPPAAEPVAEEPPRPAPETAPSFNFPPRPEQSSWAAPPAPEAPGGSSQWSAPPAPPSPEPGTEAPEDAGWTDADPTKSSQRLSGRRR
jgi:hypothetical protein